MILNTIRRSPFILIKINYLIKRLRLFSLIIIGFSCAAIQRPSGGEKDITPPTIVSTNPLYPPNCVKTECTCPPLESYDTTLPGGVEAEMAGKRKAAATVKKGSPQGG